MRGEQTVMLLAGSPGEVARTAYLLGPDLVGPITEAAREALGDPRVGFRGVRYTVELGRCDEGALERIHYRATGMLQAVDAEPGMRVEAARGAVDAAARMADRLQAAAEGLRALAARAVVVDG